MGEPLILSYEDIPQITLRRADWLAFRGWWDAIALGRASDATTNLCAECALTPDGNALAALFEEWGFLPAELAGELLANVGAPVGGIHGLYPMSTLAQERAKHARAAELRKMLGDAYASIDTALRIQLDAADAELAALSTGGGLIPLATLDMAETRSKRALFVRGPAGLLVFRPPGAGVADRFTDTVSSFFAGKPDVSFAGACRALVLGCAIEPDATVLAAQIDEFPAIVHCLHGPLREAGTPKARPRP
jgi:hypothetical protein